MDADADADADAGVVVYWSALHAHSAIAMASLGDSNSDSDREMIMDAMEPDGWGTKHGRGLDLGAADESAGPGVQWVRDFEQSPAFFSWRCMELPSSELGLGSSASLKSLVRLMMAV